jgi:single-strand DNA-binding protein
MKTINKVVLLGNLGRDVEMRYSASGEAIANLAVATSSEWRDRDSGDKQQATEWHRCVAFGKLADLIGQYCRKGSSVYFEGKLRTRKWQDKDGHDQYTTEVVLDEFINLDKREADRSAAPAPAPEERPTPAAKKAGAKPRK